MAHLVESMAYVDEAPWHGLGNQRPVNQPIDVWQQSAGMNWDIKEAKVLYYVSSEGLHAKPFAGSKVLYRFDTLAPLSEAGSRYKVVQPCEVLAFYRDLVSVGRFELKTAGILNGGRKLCAHLPVLIGRPVAGAWRLIVPSPGRTGCIIQGFHERLASQPACR